MQQTQRPVPRRSLRTRGAALLLAIALVLGLIPGFSGVSETASAHWADPYLSQLVEWGFIRSDQAENPDSYLTRADFMSIVNRAYGYTQGGPTPFDDVEESDWFYDDVGIAYNAQYIYGTSPTTVSPNDTLTRETAATILGRNMMLKESEGEILDFSDARDISPWARGTIKSSLEHYLVGGYDDGTFKPQKDLSWGEMAAMLSRIVGTPLQESGDYSMGGVFGNVTISSPGVTLRDTIISGDLYVTGGVGLGDVKLENVTVLGRIIASGTGESEGGRSSITLRNVVADELLVDNLQDHFVTIQADGITEIGQVTVRTDAYLEDNTPEGLGLKSISLEGEEGTLLDLAGRIESVAVKTPGAQVQVAKGTVNTMTVDETAPDTNVTIARGASVKELNLDTGTYVSGDGDIKKLNVNAPGSIVTMLPDEIYIRPGITAVIKDEVMDSVAAEESSLDPMILAGYPSVSDLAPTSLTAVFSTNKKGTVYWAVSAITDSSISADDLIKPPAYGSTAVARGTLPIARGNEETGAAVTGLLPGGSYYLSAVLVDDRGQRSPAKVIAFTTPDDTVPAFAEGYPYMSLVTDTMAQVTVMPTKTCKLYYALLPAGAQAPTEDELRANSVSGKLGYGVRDVVKNTEDVFQVNDLTLEEMESYDLYLWLVDANGVNQSKIEKLTFSTVDKTPPEFIVDPMVNKVEATSVGLTFRLNESGTVYWAVVEAGADYPKPRPGQDSILPSDEYAKLQVQSGLNALKFGSVKVAGSTVDGTINVTGLTAETAYDLWYVAIDDAGNYSVEVKKVTIHTLDTSGPTIVQSFTRSNSADPTDPTGPLADTGIVLTFSEDIRYKGPGGGDSLRDLYDAYNTASAANKDTALQRLVTSLSNSIKLYPSGSGTRENPVPSNVDSAQRDVAIENILVNGEPCVLDYTKATVTSRDGKVLVTFPSEALNLSSGSTYFFRFFDLTDTSTNQNDITPNPLDYTNAPEDSGHYIPRFTIVSAQLDLDRLSLGSQQLPYKLDNSGNPTGSPVDIKFSFTMEPQSTHNVNQSLSYDLLFWSETTMTFDLYYRAVDKNGNPITDSHPMPNMAGKERYSNGWYCLGSIPSNRVLSPAYGEEKGGKSLHLDFNRCSDADFPLITSLDDTGNVIYQFGICITQIGTNSDSQTWGENVNIYVNAAAADTGSLASLARGLSEATWDAATDATNPTSNVASIGHSLLDGSKTLLLSNTFTNLEVPKFSSGYPEITPGDSWAEINVALDHEGTIYYVVAPVGQVITTAEDRNNNNAVLSDRALWDVVPVAGTTKTYTYVEVDDHGNEIEHTVTLPDRNKNISGNTYTETEWVTAPNNLRFTLPNGLSPAEIKIQPYENEGVRVPLADIPELTPNTDYYLYFVLRGASSSLSQVYLYKFTTTDNEKPKFTTLQRQNGVVNLATHVNSNVEYLLLSTTLLRSSILYTQTLSGTNITSDASGKSIPPAYANMRVIDALQSFYRYTTAVADVNNNGTGGLDNYYLPGSSFDGYTVFDLYASDTLKNQVLLLIQQGLASDSSQNSLVGGPLPFSPTVDSIDRTNDMSSNSYYFVAAARHVMSTSQYGYSFAALSNVTKPDPDPPVPEFIQTQLTSRNSDGTYKGTVTIQFDKDVFYLPSDNTAEGRQEVRVTLSTPGSGDNWLSIFPLLGGNIPASDLTPGRTTSSPTNIFTLAFDHVSANSTITMFQSGWIANTTGSAEANARLTLTFGSVVTGTSDSGLPLMEIGFIPSWNGTQVPTNIEYGLVAIDTNGNPRPY